MIRQNAFRYTTALVFLLTFFAFAGCGKKGPPLPPENKAGKVAAPYDLKLIHMDKDVQLAWKHEINEKSAALKPEYFEIFMAQKTFEACEGCPFDFKSAGVVDMPMMEFYAPVQKGFKYYFRVQAVDPDKIRSPYSKTIQFEYK